MAALHVVAIRPTVAALYTMVYSHHLHGHQLLGLGRRHAVDVLCVYAEGKYSIPAVDLDPGKNSTPSRRTSWTCLPIFLGRAMRFRVVRDVVCGRVGIEGWIPRGECKAFKEILSSSRQPNRKFHSPMAQRMLSSTAGSSIMRKTSLGGTRSLRFRPSATYSARKTHIIQDHVAHSLLIGLSLLVVEQHSLLVRILICAVHKGPNVEAVQRWPSRRQAQGAEQSSFCGPSVMLSCAWENHKLQLRW